MEQEYNQGDGEECCEGGGHMMWMHHLPKEMKKQFKMAMLRKKEKMLEAKLAFVREMKDMMDKMPMMEEEKKEK